MKIIKAKLATANMINKIKTLFSENGINSIGDLIDAKVASKNPNLEVTDGSVSFQGFNLLNGMPRYTKKLTPEQVKSALRVEEILDSFHEEMISLDDGSIVMSPNECDEIDFAFLLGAEMAFRATLENKNIYDVHDNNFSEFSYFILATSEDDISKMIDEAWSAANE